MITLLPPLIFVIYFVNSFISALGYASIFVSVLLIVQPAMMGWAIKELSKVKMISLVSYIFIFDIIYSGLGIIGLQLLVAFGRLPRI